MKYSDLTGAIIGICIKVHNTLGPGLLESVYEEAICYELVKAGLSFKRQHGIPVVYDEVKLDLGFRADVIIEGKVILEIKSVESVAPVFAKTVLTYMRFTNIEVGLLINFNVVLLKDGITRLIENRKEMNAGCGNL
ncbi:MAG TPA: GxxExxY protein [Chitinophagales bacterium]|nr:GxxExxY protein [Chitinophagales bacterium]